MCDEKERKEKEQVKRKAEEREYLQKTGKDRGSDGKETKADWKRGMSV